jgi:hypothetical protein
VLVIQARLSLNLKLVNFTPEETSDAILSVRHFIQPILLCKTHAVIDNPIFTHPLQLPGPKKENKYKLLPGTWWKRLKTGV